LENTEGNLQSGIPGSNSEILGRFYDGLGSIIMVQYSVVSTLTPRGRITAREYVDRLGNQVHPMIQALFLNNDTVFQDYNVQIHTAGTIHLSSVEHAGELQHPWLTQSSDLNIIEPLWSLLETRARNRPPPPTSLKQLGDVLHEEWYRIPLETNQNLYESIPRRIDAVLKAMCLFNTTLIKKSLQYLQFFKYLVRSLHF
jgi:hypothetical protein